MAMPRVERPGGSGWWCRAVTLVAACCAASALPPAPLLGQPAHQPPEQPAEDPPEPGNPELPDDTDDERESIVHMKDGSRAKGVIVEEDEQRIVARIGGIFATFDRADVDHVEPLPTVLEQYRQMRDSMDEGDSDQLVKLAEWLIVRGKHAWALRELTGVLDRDPGHPDARRLATLARSQLELRDRAARRVAPIHDPADAATRPEFPVLGPRDIAVIKVMEIDLADPPRMTIGKGTIDRLVTAHASDPLIPVSREGREALYRKRPEQILELMFRLRARDLYGEVEVHDQPRSMRLFRDTVHEPWLMPRCATNDCHGGAAAGRLWLHNRRINSDETVYTNFLILDRFRTSDGRALIDYARPERSPLLQIGLPRERSSFPHPPLAPTVGGLDEFRPAFRSGDDRRFEQAVEWIRAMYNNPRPDYPVDYTPPAPDAAAEARPPDGR